MRVSRWVRRYPVEAFIVASTTGAILWGIAAWLTWSYWPSLPTTPAAEVASIRVQFLSWSMSPGSGQAPENTSATTEDPVQIHAILEVFRQARRTSDHKCGNMGSLTLRRKDGREEVLQLLPGHNPTFYEYRYQGKINRVDREKLLAALHAIGIRNVTSSPF